MNYQKELDALISELLKKEQIPSLLLHSCCAPCSSYVLEYLSSYFSITVYYDNPNIFPEEEYHRRIHEQKRFIEEIPAKYPIQFVCAPYQHRYYLSRVKGLEKEPEGGARCKVCFDIRLEHSAKYAKEHNFDFFTTTLTISPMKNAALLNEIGQEKGEKYQVSFLPSDFKKKNGYLRSVQLSKEFGLYRQDYCGCEFSKIERGY